MRARLTTWSTVLALALLAVPAGAEEAAPNRIPWSAWNESTFARAKAEGRIVLVVVSTSWCHWCHVMQRETYADPRVERALARAFVPVKVDADARPDLAERFRAYRWPATGFLAPDGAPVLALRGYRSADEFLPILADVEQRVRRGGPYPGFDAPVPSATPVGEPDRAALEALRARLVAQLDATYDPRFQGWGRGQKYPLAEPILWGLRRARTHPREALPLRRALDTLAQQERLIDPVWGGMFQYSVGPDWDEPHYEKLMEVNAGALAAYAQAFALTGNERWRADAVLIAAWFERFLLAPEGVFFANQDAEVGGREATAFHRLDDAGRRRVGVPRVDTNVYARENGLAIQAHVLWAAEGGGDVALARGIRAAERILATHRDANGLFRHGGSDGAGLRYLADQAEMGRALLALARATGDPRWSVEASRLAEALGPAFAVPEGGFADATAEPGIPGTLGSRRRALESNASAARFLLAAARVHDRPAWRREAGRALLAVGEPTFAAAHWRYVGGLLLGVEEALAAGRKVTLHGDPADPRTRALLLAASRAAARDPDLLVVGAEVPLAAGLAPFAVVCRSDASCSDPLADPAVLDLELGDRLPGVPRQEGSPR